jgi:HAD superfamily hydrolase (TIGR01509 family)
VLRGVLFDWGETLVHFEFESERFAAGHAAGLRAVGRELESEPPPFDPRDDYGSYLRGLYGLSDDELPRFLEAEHEVWIPAHHLASTTHALLESLRERGLRLGIVSNAFDPPELLHRDLELLGVAQRVDAAVFSSEIGVRKPDPAIFEAVLARLGTRPEDTLFVGDSAVELAAARRLGMPTCQALWFAAEEPGEADFEAFTQMDVLTFVGRLVSA